MTGPEREIVELDQTLPLDQAMRVVNGQAQIALGSAALERCANALERLETAVGKRRQIYGVTTGFGPLANRLIEPADSARLQQNLVHHLASGVGPPLRWDQARALVLARLISLAQGASGVSRATLDRLVTLLNSTLAPVIPARGTVGASGDLTPLAHLVLCLQGRGSFCDAQGTVLNGPDGLQVLGLAPLTLGYRDGLALVNGTAAMTGVALVNAHHMERALRWNVAITAALGECLSARVEAWDPAFAVLRPHAGQARAADGLRAHTQDSRRLEREPLATRVLPEDTSAPAALAGQDAYTLRCAPQVIGAVWDTADWHRRIVDTELASVTDNPIFPVAGAAPALHGGNFMGAHIALASDAVANGAVVLAGLAERQIARITDETLNRGLPAFLSGGAVGLNSGLMGAQVTATALLAEMRATGAASVQSLSTNAANQDVVSMGTIAARAVDAKIMMLFDILAIAGIAAAQAMDLREAEDAPRAFSKSAQQLRAKIRHHVPHLNEDRPLGREIAAVSQMLRSLDPPVPATA